MHSRSSIRLSIASDQLYSVQASDGKQLWHWPLPPITYAQYTLNLVDGILYVGPQWQGGIYNAGTYRGHLYALQATNGALLWDRQLQVSSLVSLSASAGSVYLLSAGVLDVLQANDGKLLRHQPLQQVGLVVTNGIIYASTAGNANTCFPLTNSKLTALRVYDGTQVWYFESGSFTDPSLP